MVDTRQYFFIDPYFEKQRQNATRTLFDPDRLRNQKRITRELKGRGSTYFFKFAGKNCVLRHYWRGGFVRKLSKDGYLWLGLKRSRAYREWKILEKIRELGLPAPRTVAIRIQRKGLVCRSDIVTTEIEGAESFGKLLRNGLMETDVWEKVGSVIRNYHDHGIFHQDLNANNILVNQDQIYLIDFDRARVCKGEWWKSRMLGRLKGALEKSRFKYQAFHYRDEDWRALMAGYEAA